MAEPKEAPLTTAERARTTAEFAQNAGEHIKALFPKVAQRIATTASHVGKKLPGLEPLSNTMTDIMGLGDFILPKETIDHTMDVLAQPARLRVARKKYSPPPRSA